VIYEQMYHMIKYEIQEG